mgnify:FL=1
MQDSSPFLELLHLLHSEKEAKEVLLVAMRGGG